MGFRCSPRVFHVLGGLVVFACSLDAVFYDRISPTPRLFTFLDHTSPSSFDFGYLHSPRISILAICLGLAGSCRGTGLPCRFHSAYGTPPQAFHQVLISFVFKSAVVERAKF